MSKMQKDFHTNNAAVVAAPPHAKLAALHLTEDSLDIPRQFSLADVIEANPGFHELLRKHGAPENTLSVTTCNFLPELISSELREKQLWVIQSPHITKDQASSMLHYPPSAFLGAGQMLTVGLAWGARTVGVCVEYFDTVKGSVLESTNSAIVVVIVNGGDFTISAFSIEERFVDYMGAAEQATMMPRAREARKSGEIDVNDDDIDFDGDIYTDRIIGPSGDECFILDVVEVRSARLLVPTRRLIGQALDCTGSLLRRLASGAASLPTCLDNEPTTIQMLGCDLPCLISEPCHKFPVLLTFLSESMHTEGKALAESYLYPENIISPDGQSSMTCLALQGREHQLLLDCAELGLTLNRAEDYHELIVVFVCGQQVWMRYVLVDAGWHEQLYLTNTCAVNYRPGSLEIPPELEAPDYSTNLPSEKPVCYANIFLKV